MNDELFQRFTVASRHLNLSPLLSSEEIEQFRVAYDSRTLAILEDALLDDIEPHGKLIFTGHRGCGKYPAEPAGDQYG